MVVLLHVVIEEDNPLLVPCSRNLAILLMDTTVLLHSAKENILKECSSSKSVQAYILSFIKKAYECTPSHLS